MLIYCICTQYLVVAPFALITASIRRGMEVISLWHCWGGMEAQVSLTVAFSSSALLGLVSLIFLLTIPHILYGVQVRRVCWPNKHSKHHGHWTSFWYLWQCGQVPSPAGKWNQHLHKACQQKEAWSALKFPGRWLRWLWTQKTQWTNTSRRHGSPNHHWLETSHWTSNNMDSVPLQSSSRLWDLISKWMQKFTFIWKEDFGPLIIFLHSPGKTLLTFVSGSEVAW